MFQIFQYLSRVSNIHLYWCYCCCCCCFVYLFFLLITRFNVTNLDDSSPFSSGREKKFLWQFEHLTQPIHHRDFQLCARWVGRLIGERYSVWKIINMQTRMLEQIIFTFIRHALRLRRYLKVLMQQLCFVVLDGLFDSKK